MWLIPTDKGLIHTDNLLILANKLGKREEMFVEMLFFSGNSGFLKNNTCNSYRVVVESAC